MVDRLRLPPRALIAFQLALLIAVTTAPHGHAAAGKPAASRQTARAAADPEFGSHWHDGRAELDGYRLTVQRYGEPRVGQAVMVFVTEPFRASTRVKADDPSRASADVFEVLKLNFARDFQTGIYDYNTMVSLFVRSDSFEPVKLTFTSTEWCGNVYEELLVDPKQLQQRIFSYFEGESTAGPLPRPPGGVIEEELFVRLRGLRGEYMRPGTTRAVPFLAGSFHRRMTHVPARWTRAVIEHLAAPERVEVPAGSFVTRAYVVRVADGREGRFHVEAAWPHRIVKWAWSAPRATATTVSDAGELTGTQRLAYWQLNGNGGERSLRALGLAPLPGPPGR